MRPGDHSVAYIRRRAAQVKNLKTNLRPKISAHADKWKEYSRSSPTRTHQSISVHCTINTDTCHFFAGALVAASSIDEVAGEAG